MIKNWIKKILGITKLENELKQANVKLEATTKDINHRVDSYRNQVLMGLNVSYNEQYGERSWAVVCINGKQPIVEFIELTGLPPHVIKEWASEFQTSHKTYDAPPTMFTQKLKRRWN